MIPDGLYHCDIGIPADVLWPEIGKTLSYTRHAYQAACKDCVERLLPWSLPAYRIIEVQILEGVAVKWVVRCDFLADRDLVLVITSTYRVKTVWLNHKNDQHTTLRREQYRELETA